MSNLSEQQCCPITIMNLDSQSILLFKFFDKSLDSTEFILHDTLKLNNSYSVFGFSDSTNIDFFI